MRRRTLLSTVGAVGLTGCTFGRFDDGEVIHLGVIEFENRTGSERSLEVAVTADEELAFEGVVQVPAGDPSGHARLERRWPEQARRYSIRIQSEIESEPLTIPVTESRAEACETFLIRLQSDDIVPYRGSDGRCYDGQAPPEEEA
jgi:hypothetical protein